jgi:hypothetical protein
MRRLVAAVIVAVVVAATAPVALAYLKLGTRQGAALITLRWNSMPIRYFVTNSDVPNVSAPQLRDAAGRAFATWAAAPDVTISSQFVGFTGATAASGDRATVLGFSNRPDLDKVLGSTSFIVDTVTGEVLESDIFFNSMFAWSAASAGEPSRHDIESIALHEIGHLLGLGHSMLGETVNEGGGRRVLGAEAVMFPIAFSPGTLNRALRPDDVAGIADIYGSDTFRKSTGSITGRILKNGSGVLGAHVIAFNPATGAMVGGFTLSPDGTFVIAGLEPGPQLLRVEPLDDGDVGSFLDPTLNIDADFQVAFYPRLVTVPRGGTSRSVDITVVAK